VAGARGRQGSLSAEEERTINAGRHSLSVILRARVWRVQCSTFAQQILDKGAGVHVAANCNVAAGKATNKHELWWTVRKRGGPNGGPDLILGASVGTACVHGYFGPSGSYFLSLYTRAVAGQRQRYASGKFLWGHACRCPTSAQVRLGAGGERIYD